MLIVVEGPTDKDFMELYIEHLCPIIEEKDKKRLESCKIKNTNGNRNLKSVKVEIEKHEQVKIIFDADADFENSKNKIAEQLEDMGNNFSSKCEIFLMPNNKDSGDLEKLLENIAREECILKCFDNYEGCLRKLQKNNQNVRLPAKKSKAYAYFHAFGFKNGVKNFKFNDSMIDFKNEYLQPLKNFLLDKKIEDK